MGTKLSELRRKVLMGFKDLVGEDAMMAEEAINQACHTMAEVQNFDDLLVYDTTSAKTVDGTSQYHWVTNWSLTRPKDILSIVLHDDFNSRKLRYLPKQEFDEKYPYPAGYAEAKPEVYTKQGDYITLFATPDAAYDLYISYYQWPLVLVDDDDQCSYVNLDSSIIALARDIFISFRGKMAIDIVARARGYLKEAIKDDNYSPDDRPIARGFSSTPQGYHGEYWNDPFIKQVR